MKVVMKSDTKDDSHTIGDRLMDRTIGYQADSKSVSSHDATMKPIYVTVFKVVDDHGHEYIV